MDRTRRMFIGGTIAAVGAAKSASAQQADLREPVRVESFGVVGDGVTDNRAAIVAAVAVARGKRLVFPEGNYLIDTDGGPITLEEVTIDGQGVLDGATGSIDQGVNFWISGRTHSPFRIRRGVSVCRLGIYYPEQRDSPSPAPYPPTFAFDFSAGPVQFVRLTQLVVYNAYRFLDINDPAGDVGHVEITDNYICALNRGIYLRHNLEHLRIQSNNFTFGHWIGATERGARGYMRANATALQVDRTDGVEFVDNLVFGHLNGIRASAAGLCQFMNVSGNKLDQVLYAIRARGPGRFDGIIAGNTFNSFNSEATARPGRSISIETSGPGLETITIEGNNFDLATEEHIYSSGDAPTRTIVIGPNNYRSWAGFKSSGVYGAINTNGALTNVQVTGGWFYGSNNARHSNGIMGSLNTLQLTGATFDHCVAALNIAASAVTTSGNRSFTTLGPTADVIASQDISQSGNRWDKASGSDTSPAFLVRKAATQAFNGPVGSTVTFEQEIYDKGGNFASSVFTATQGGRHSFAYALMHDARGTAGDRWVVAAVQNRSRPVFEWAYAMNADVGSLAGHFEIELASGDTMELQIRRASGRGSFSTYEQPLANFFSGKAEV